METGLAKGIRRIGPVTFLLIGAVLLGAAPHPANAQEESCLLDKFSIGIGGDWNGISTRGRVDSRRLGIGTDIDFEGDLDLDASQINPNLRIEWRLKKHHVLRLLVNDIERSSVKETDRELQFGDLVIPVGTTLQSKYDIQTSTLGYSYFLALKEHLGFGVNVGIRVLDIGAFRPFLRPERPFGYERLSLARASSSPLEPAADQRALVRGRSIPSFFMRERRVLWLMPRRSAAFPLPRIFQSHSSTTCRM